MKVSRVNVQLTNYARGLTQDTKKGLADFLAPRVVTGGASGKYRIFSDKNAFQTANAARAVGGTAKRLLFADGDGSFNCKPYALEIGIDDHEKDLAAGDVEQIKEAKIKTLVTTAHLSREITVLSAARKLTAKAGVGQWSDEAKDPIQELDALILAIAEETGLMPNRLALGITAWNVLRNHPAVKDRFSGLKASVGMSDFANCLINPQIEIRTGVLSTDKNKFGAAADKKFIIGGELILFYGQDATTQYDASFMKSFSPRTDAIQSVREYRDDAARSDIYALDWTEEVQITSEMCGRRIVLS